MFMTVGVEGKHKTHLMSVFEVETHKVLNFLNVRRYYKLLDRSKDKLY
jgi:hypothetical protein